jgi:ABC-2 type transport system permease protein
LSQKAQSSERQMTRPGSTLWLARHEVRLSWRDWIWLITGGHSRRAVTAGIIFVVFVLFLHSLAYVMLGSVAERADVADPQVLLVITGSLAMSSSLMLSQALESVTRGFYARGDFDLILASPVSAWRLFAVRITAMGAAVAAQSLVLAAPFVNVLVWRGGAHWLGAYAVTVALAMDAVAISVALTVALFRAIGPRRTRFVAQILAAIIGAAFVIAAQFAAILSMGTMSRTALFLSPALAGFAPGPGSLLWWPARAALGQPLALAALCGLSLIALGGAIAVFAPRFERLALAAGAVAHQTAVRHRRPARFHGSGPEQALRRKEWVLLLRDPWLMSQTLMQLLYLLPAAFLLSRSFYGGVASALLVPILIMAAGQLGGGLAWLAVSGEDAPDLVASAPVSRTRMLRAKVEAVLGGIAVVFAPFVVALALFAPFPALVAAGGIAIAAGSATAIQFWFRAQARRSLFRRRQVSSRLATFSEALSSIGWAGTGALAATGTWLAIIPGLMVLAIVGGAWLISPVRSPAVV